MSRTLPATILLSAALLAACGGAGDDARAPAGEPAGRAASEAAGFVADGDELCGRLAERFPNVRASRLEQTPAAGLKAASRYREYTRELSAGLAGLSAPEDAEARQILATSSRLAAAAKARKLRQKRVVATIERGNTEAAFREALSSVRAQQRMVREFAAPLDSRMRAYGFKVCGRSSGAKTSRRAGG